MDSSIRDAVLKTLIIARRWWLLLVIPAVLMIPLSIAAALFAPGGYSSRALVLMQENTASSPLSRDGGVQSREYVNDTFLGIRALLKSDFVLGNVLDLQAGVSDEAKRDPVKRAYLLRTLASRVRVELVGTSVLQFHLDGGARHGLGDELQSILASLFDVLMFPPEENAQKMVVKTISERLALVDGQIAETEGTIARLLPEGLATAEKSLSKLQTELEQLSASLGAGDPSPGIRTAVDAHTKQIAVLSDAIRAYKVGKERLAELPAQRSILQARLDAVKRYFQRDAEIRSLLRAPQRMIIIDPPRDPDIRNQSRLSWLILGAIGGLLLGVLMVTVAEVLDPTIRSIEQLAAVPNTSISARLARLIASGVAGSSQHRAEPVELQRPSAVGDNKQVNPRSPGIHAAEAIVLAVLVASFMPVPPSMAAPHIDSAVQLPAAEVSIDIPVVTGRKIEVKSGDNLQAAIDAARGGDEIVLTAGAVFKGSYTLRNRGDKGWVTIRSSGPLPEEGVRATREHVGGMATILAPGSNQSAITTDPGAHNYFLIGLHITAAPENSQLTSLVNLSPTGRHTMDALPRDIVIDRSYLHGNDKLELKRAVALNSAATAIVNSTLDEVHHTGSDSQAICGWTGPGPFLIQNNTLEGSGENIMFGGADPVIAGVLPRDITIRGNDITKPGSWRGRWLVKNLLELKLGQRVLIEKNTLRNNWADGQSGFAINMKTTNQDGRAPWSNTSHVTFRDNIVKDTPSAIKIASGPEGGDGIAASHFAIYRNTFENIGTSLGPDEVKLFLLLSGKQPLTHITIAENVAVRGVATLGALIFFEGEPIRDMKFTGNVVVHGAYGIKGSGASVGKSTLDRYAPGVVFDSNTLIGAIPQQYGDLARINRFPAVVDQVNTLR